MTAQPAHLALRIYRGDPCEVTLSSTLDGVAETVVAGDALAQIRADVDADTVAAAFTVSVTGAAVKLTLTAAQTADLDPGTYVWDFQPDADAETWIAGPVAVVGDVSRAA